MLLTRMLPVLLLTTLGFSGCAKEGKDVEGNHQPISHGSNHPVEVGGIYATPYEDGTWQIVRVLALDEHTAHIRSYTDRFSEPPRNVALAKLKWFMGHLPVDRTGFENEQRVLI